jgi:hypothetical protein
MDTRSYIVWTDDEWKGIANRAKKMKQSKPEMPWTQVVMVCQDDIAPERRRFHIGRLTQLKPLFEILNLDASGNEKPVKPVVAAPEAELPTVSPLSDIPALTLLTELFARGSFLKEELSKLEEFKAQLAASLTELTAFEARVVEKQNAGNESFKAIELSVKNTLSDFGKRLNGIEDSVLTALEDVDKFRTGYDQMIQNVERVNVFLSKQEVKTAVEHAAPATPATPAPTVSMPAAPAPATVVATPAATPKNLKRFLVFGPSDKEIPRITQRLGRGYNVELILGENQPHAKLPQVDYVLVSGHNDYTRRWQTVRDHYGDKKAFRLNNGALMSFVTAIERLHAFGTV